MAKNIPRTIRPLEAHFFADGTNAVKASFSTPTEGDVRIVLRQSANGKPVRSSRGAPPNGTTLGKILQIQASQEDRSLPVEINYDKAIWSGLSWAVGEVRSRDLNSGVPTTVRCRSLEDRLLELSAEVYVVTPQGTTLSR